MKYWLVKNSWGARKCHPKNDGPKVISVVILTILPLLFFMDLIYFFLQLQVSFFSDDEETTSTPKADALFIPRENPRALVIRPLKQWPGKSSAEKLKKHIFSSTNKW